MPEDRRLAAIMFTDIVGYTTLMGRDEDKAFDMLARNHKIHETLIKKHNGILIKEIGDGTLASFPSASNAVRCAMDIQKEAKSLKIPLKIGIHEGEMVFAGKDVLGDGVNVASRLQELSHEGCITISGTVQKDIKNKSGINTKHLGDKKLKNVDDAVKVYEVLCMDEFKVASDEKKISPKRKHPYYFAIGLILIVVIVLIWFFYPLRQIVTEDSGVEKSIAVLPFKDLSAEKNNQYFCDGIMEGILNNLSKIQGLQVASRTSTEKYRETSLQIPQIAKEIDVSYLLEASVFKSENKIRVSTQLINAINDEQIWSEQYDRELRDVFKVMSEISLEVASEIKIAIAPEIKESIEIVPTDNLEAYELYLKGRFFWYRRTSEDLKRSIFYFNQSIQLDSTYTLAYAGLADTYYIMAWWGWYPVDDGYSKAKDYALKALSVNNSTPEVHVTLGGISAYHDYNWVDAEKKFKLAISLDPNYATAYQEYSEILDILKRNEEAREQINISLKLKPHSYIMNHLNSILYYHNADYKKAIEWSEKALAISTNNATMLLILKCYVRLGMDNEAIEHIKNIISVDASSNNHVLVIKMYQKSGIKGVIYWFIDWILLNESKEFFMISNYWIASLYAIIGDSKNAVEYLEKGFDLHEGNLPKINNNPDFEILKTDPKFTVLLKKMQLL